MPGVSFQDSSIILGFIGLCLYLARSDQTPLNSFLLAGFFSGTLLLCTVAPIEHYYWYKIPLLPLMIIGLGNFCLLCFQGNRIALILLVALAVMQFAQNAGSNAAIAGSRFYLSAVLLAATLLFIDPVGRIRRTGCGLTLIGIWLSHDLRLLGAIH